MKDPEKKPGDDPWYRLLFEANPMPMLICDRETFAILDANRSAELQYGNSRADLLRMSVRDLFVRQDIERALQPAKAKPQELFQCGTVLHHVRKDGSRIHVQVLQHSLPFHGRQAMLLMLNDVTEQRRLERALNEAEEIGRLGCWVADRTRKTMYWSDQTYRNLGMEPQSVPADFEHLRRCLHPDDKDRVMEMLEHSLESGEPYDCEHRVVWPDGSIHVVHACGRLASEKGGSPSHFIGTLHDISQQRQLNRQLREAQRDLQKAQKLAHIGGWTWNPAQDAYRFSSDETYRIFGFKREQMPASTAVAFRAIHPDDRERVLAARARALAGADPHYETEYRVVHADGKMHYVRSVGEVVPDAEGRPAKIIGMVQDITASKRAEQEILRLALHDGVTGLLNQAAFRAQVGTMLNREGGGSLLLLIINVLPLRDINYTLGHVNGDRLLKEVGARLRDAAPAGACVARLGNFQFALALPDVSAPELMPAARAILAGLERPFPVGEIAFELSAYVGAALAPDDGIDAETLLRKAGIALYNARQSGNSFMMYRASQDPYNPRRLALIGEFRKAISEGQLRLYCQPKREVGSGRVSGVEALVRWQHPVFGLISPDQFIPLIESTDLIHLLTRFMLQAAVSQCHAWRQQGIRLPVAVNVSTRNLIEAGFAADVHALMEQWNLKPGWLGLEITESSLMSEPVAALEALDALSRMGHCLYVDDFGIGYSSLSYLTKLPVNAIKIDHSFTMRMIEDRRSEAIVKSTVDLAHSLELNVVAEGTASQDIWNALRRIGCDEAQGYFIASPMPVQDIPAWLASVDYRPQQSELPYFH
jgi:diguanylate cyclase (GGDEF)-like protein/PAS domain S-box-containing protein